jgi:hypothetical protein
MKHYYVSYRLPNRGQSVYPDPCAGGDYYEDLYKDQFILAANKQQVLGMILKIYPDAKGIDVMDASTPYKFGK